MMKPLDKEKAFAAIAEELELPLVLLANPDSRVRLVMLEKIGAALSSTNLTFRDLAERVVAPRPARVEPLMAAPPPMPMVALRPVSEIHVDKPDPSCTPAEPLPGGRVLTNEQLSAYGYRSNPDRGFGGPDAWNGSALHFGSYGTGPVPDTCEMIPGESVDAAGERIANWALAASGQPFWEDPSTRMAYLPGVTVPGKGKVRPNGTLGPLPVEE